MKKRHTLYGLIVPVAMFFGEVLPAAATEPPAQMNQKIGMPDGIFNNLLEADCRICHSDPGNANPKLLADRHHLKKGQIIPRNTVAPNGVPGDTYRCEACHWNAQLNAYDVTGPVNDCLACHKQIPDVASVHHLTSKAIARDCKACHGMIDNPDDGHYIPTSPGSFITPLPGLGLGPGGIGGCAYCHKSGVDAVTGLQIASTADTHHNIGLVSGPFTGGFTAGCSLCHVIDSSSTAPKIRPCEKCHSVQSLHTIQTDSNCDCILMCCRMPEQPGYGHVATLEDCKGCHNVFYSAVAMQAISVPITPDVASLSAYSIPAGEPSVMTLSGSAFTNYISNGDSQELLTSTVFLRGDNGRRYYLSPGSISENSMEVVFPPYIAAGNYELRVVKEGKYSNTKVITVLPEIKIISTTCDNTAAPAVLTITGRDFNEFSGYASLAVNISISSGEQMEACGVVSYDDTRITANCNSCGDQIQVTSLFGTTPAPIGAPTQCLGCHGDNRAAVNCENVSWRKHTVLMDSPAYWAAEMAYLGYLCRERPSILNIKERSRK